MIKYQLVCNSEHTFDSWFASSSAFDALKSAGELTCPSCGSVDVRKAIMAPNVSVSTRRDEPVAATPQARPAAAVAPAQPPVPTVALDAETRKRLDELVNAVREIRRELMEKADNVGPKFAEEARKIHFAEVEPRAIYGQATPEEAQSLLEDGVDFFTLPTLPEDQN